MPRSSTAGCAAASLTEHVPIFQEDEDARGLWAEVLRTPLSEIRIEFVTELSVIPKPTCPWPWELRRS